MELREEDSKVSVSLYKVYVCEISDCESVKLTSFSEVHLGSSNSLITVIDFLQVAGVFFMPGMQEKVVSLIGPKCNCTRKSAA